MEFLKWYSAMIMSWFTITAIFVPTNVYAFIGGIIFIPITIFLWKIIIDKKL